MAQNNFETIIKYLTDFVDTVLCTESKTKDLENGQKYIDYDFKEAGMVKIADILMDGLSDYHRTNHAPVDGTSNYTQYLDGVHRDGYASGGADLNWQVYKLRFDRGRQFRIDNMDNEETAGLMVANLVSEFVRTKVVPEVDAVRFASLASTGSASFGNLVTAKTIADNKIISEFNSAEEWLSEHDVPVEDQIIYVNPHVMALIKNTTELVKHLTQAEYRDGDVTFKYNMYDGKPIVEVPSNRFFTNVNVGSNGYNATSASKVINYMVCSKRAIVPVTKLEKIKIWTPDQVQDFDGYKVNFHMYHDVIVPKNKIAGVYTSVSDTTASEKSNVLDVDVKFVSTGKYVIDRYFTTPAGLRGTLVRSASSFTVGTVYSIDSSTIVTNVQSEYGKIGSETSQYYAILDGNGRAIAVSKAITLPTK